MGLGFLKLRRMGSGPGSGAVMGAKPTYPVSRTQTRKLNLQAGGKVERVMGIEPT
jgi:hypothetical protein